MCKLAAVDRRLTGMNKLRLAASAVLVLTVAYLLPSAAFAHPGSGIVVDRLGQVWFVDMVRGVWKLDTRGALTHLPGPGFHWMTLDGDDRFAATRLPSGSDGDVERIGAHPTLLLGSDYPLAIGRDGNLYYPTHDGAPVRILRLLPSGRQSVLTSLPEAPPGGRPIRDLNGLAAGPDGSLYYTRNDGIRRISREGSVTTVVEKITIPGCTTGPLLRGLDVDARGTVYVAATGCGTVLKVTPVGQVTVLPQVSNAWAPTGVALFGSNVYVLEFQNPDSDDRREMLPRVRKIGADGKTAVVATVTRH